MSDTKGTSSLSGMLKSGIDKLGLSSSSFPAVGSLQSGVIWSRLERSGSRKGAEAVQFEAQRELGEKLAIVASYGTLLLQGMDGGIGDEYTGQERTAAIRGHTANALEQWNPAHPYVPTPELPSGGSSFLGRSDTGSFGSTHAHELSQLDHASLPPQPSPSFAQTGHSSDNTPLSTPPILPTRPVPIPVPNASLSSASHQSSSSASLPSGVPPINLAPTSPPPIPTATFSPPLSPSSAAQQAVTSPTLPAIPGVPAGPTVAETGEPIVGTGGPASGQLAPRPPPSADIPPISLASVGSPTPGQAKRDDAAAERARAEASFERGSLDGAEVRSDVASVGGHDDSSTREQAIRWKEAEAAKDRLAAASSNEGSSGINRMATTSRRRMEANEAEFGAADEGAPPAYQGVDESVAEAARRT
ncbi:hypothetical protein RQP46_009137 [Phenoliferia psychrophenolica]